MSDQERSPLAVNYAAQWWASVAVAVLVVAIGAIQAVGPEQLGIPTIAFRWLGILAACLGFAQAVLPKIQSVPIQNYDEVKRVEALTSEPPEGETYPAEFVDAVAESLLRKRAEDLERRFPVAGLPRPQAGSSVQVSGPLRPKAPHG